MDSNQSNQNPSQKARRKFLKTAGKVAITAPAAAMLLSATNSKNVAHAVSGPTQFPNGPTGPTDVF